MREGVERKIDREGEKGEKEVREGGGVGVLMLVLWDWGEGHKNPALTAFLKRGILSFHRAFCPSVFVVLHLRLGCLRPGRGPYFGVCVVTVNNPQSSPNPHKALSRRTNHPLQLWFCHLWILCLFVLLLFTPILFLFPPPIPPHHPPIIFQALSWLSLPKPSGLIVWSWGIESAGWNEKWGSRSASLFILFSFPLSFISLAPPFSFPTSLSHSISLLLTQTHKALCRLFHSCFVTFCGLPHTCQSHPVPPLLPVHLLLLNDGLLVTLLQEYVKENKKKEILLGEALHYSLWDTAVIYKMFYTKLQDLSGEIQSATNLCWWQTVSTTTLRVSKVCYVAVVHFKIMFLWNSKSVSL